LGILLTRRRLASLISPSPSKNQKDISAKMGRIARAYRRREDENSRTSSPAIAPTRYDARERNLMVEGQLKRFFSATSTSI